MSHIFNERKRRAKVMKRFNKFHIMFVLLAIAALIPALSEGAGTSDQDLEAVS
jgi:hypothetical protein